MKKFTIITDSGCDLKTADITGDLVELVTIPLTYRFGESEEFTDCEKNDMSALTAKIASSKQAGKTACPSPEQFAESMRNAQSNHIFVITLGSKISGTYNSARLAAETVTSEDAKRKIFVLDGMSATSGLVRIAYKLLEIIQDGEHDFDILCEKLIAIRKKNHTRFLLNDLSTLVKSGRMSKVAGIIATITFLKLICGDNGEGEIKMHKKVMGLKKGIETMAEMPACKELGKDKDDLIIISHCNNAEGAGILKTLLEKSGFTNIKTFLMRGIATIYANEKGIAIAY
jgi:DegV family protein with EDD domain